MRVPHVSQFTTCVGGLSGVAQRMFPNQEALNRHLTRTDPVMKFIGVTPTPLRIVGVAADIDDEHMVPGPTLTVYEPFGQGPFFGGRLFVHVRSNPYTFVSAIARTIRDLSADQPVERPATLEDVRGGADARSANRSCLPLALSSALRLEHGLVPLAPACVRPKTPEKAALAKSKNGCKK
jgi:hypothetical protein